MSIYNRKGKHHLYRLNLYFVPKILIFLISPKVWHHKKENDKQQTTWMGVGFHDSPPLNQTIE